MTDWLSSSGMGSLRVGSMTRSSRSADYWKEVTHLKVVGERPFHVGEAAAGKVEFSFGR